MITIALADSQALTSAGTKYVINQHSDFSVVGEAMQSDTFRELVLQHQPTLVIADYTMADSITLDDLRKVKDLSPHTNILIISADNNKASILEALQAGVTGYLTKECSHDEIIMAIQSVARGEKFYCHKILNIIMEKHFSADPVETAPTQLTSRESEILKLLASGYSTQKVADELFLSPHTVHTHRKSIIKKLNIKYKVFSKISKLNIKSPTEFVIHALDLGLIKMS